MDDEGRCSGKITALRLAGLIREITHIGRKSVEFDVERFIESSGAKPLTAFEPRFNGLLQFGDVSNELADDSIPSLCIASRYPETPSAQCKAGDLIIVSNPDAPLPGEVARESELLGIALIESSLDPLETVLNVFLAMPIRNFFERDHPTFHPRDRVKDVQREIGKYNEGGFIILDDRGGIEGVIARISFLNQSKFRVALVDHNEYSQAIDGIEDADVLEIIDHHRLGNRATDSPITFINKVVGSTSTIVAELYRTMGFTPTRSIAGLMLSAILSDTVILKSPTSGTLDREMAGWLASIAEAEIEEYGRRMFAAGSDMGELDADKIVAQDQKLYSEGEWSFSVSQVEIVGFAPFYEREQNLRESLEATLERIGCHFCLLMVTDITLETSLLLAAGTRKVLDSISYPKMGEGLYEMKNVLSRKKQVLPYILDLLREL